MSEPRDRRNDSRLVKAGEGTIAAWWASGRRPARWRRMRMYPSAHSSYPTQHGAERTERRNSGSCRHQDRNSVEVPRRLSPFLFGA